MLRLYSYVCVCACVLPQRSKAWEWFDTALLVAKGKPVSWLQYTHHGSTAILTALNMVRLPK